jgi:hypothetical protein
MSDALAAAPDTPSISARPADLVPMKEAAALVDRSVSSVRAWLRSGKLAKHREDPANAGSRAMVSRAELLAYAASMLDPTPARPPAGPRPAPLASEAPTPDDARDLRVDLARARAELDGARAVLEATRAHVRSLEAEISRAGELMDGARAEGREVSRLAEERARDLRTDLEHTREELTAARAELAAFRSYAGLPWWRRMVAGPTAPALEVAEG